MCRIRNHESFHSVLQTDKILTILPIRLDSEYLDWRRTKTHKLIKLQINMVGKQEYKTTKWRGVPPPSLTISKSQLLCTSSSVQATSYNSSKHTHYYLLSVHSLSPSLKCFRFGCHGVDRELQKGVILPKVRIQFVSSPLWTLLRFPKSPCMRLSCSPPSYLLHRLPTPSPRFSSFSWYFSCFSNGLLLC